MAEVPRLFDKVELAQRHALVLKHNCHLAPDSNSLLFPPRLPRRRRRDRPRSHSGPVTAIPARTPAPPARSADRSTPGHGARQAGACPGGGRWPAPYAGCRLAVRPTSAPYPPCCSTEAGHLGGPAIDSVGRRQLCQRVFRGADAGLKDGGADVGAGADGAEVAQQAAGGSGQLQQVAGAQLVVDQGVDDMQSGLETHLVARKGDAGRFAGRAGGGGAQKGFRAADHAGRRPRRRRRFRGQRQPREVVPREP